MKSTCTNVQYPYWFLVPVLIISPSSYTMLTQNSDTQNSDIFAITVVWKLGKGNVKVILNIY